VESPVAESPVVESPVVESPVVESPVAEQVGEPSPAAEEEAGPAAGAAAELAVEAEAEPVVEAEAPAPAAVNVRPALEAILMVVDEPVTDVTLAQVLEQPTERINAELAALAEEYATQGRGFELRRSAGGWRFYTHPDQSAYVERFVLDGQSVRLTQAALETLAVVAYKQPVTRSRISAIRGVNCDGVVRTLVTRGLIEECGTEPESGAHLYRTTVLFLEKLGLDTVEELPALAPFLPDDVDEIADAQRG
jgi:segregation and condensation protein B